MTGYAALPTKRGLGENNMAQYRKTALIEATHWMAMGDHPEVTPHNDNFQAAQFELCKHCMRDFNSHGLISTMEDGVGVAHVVCPGDWIATGHKGEHWAIKDEVFKATYEAV